MIGQSGAAVDVELVEPGMQVLALDLNDDTDAEMIDVRGGVVVAIGSDPDPETGEVQRRFIVAKRGRHQQVRWASLRADEVRQVLPYDSSAVRKLVCAMAGIVAEHKGRPFTDEHRKLIDAMAALAPAS